jgi:hypothetical protein
MGPSLWAGASAPSTSAARSLRGAKHWGEVQHGGLRLQRLDAGYLARVVRPNKRRGNHFEGERAHLGQCRRRIKQSLTIYNGRITAGRPQSQVSSIGVAQR